jgi:SSS family solute:Na+ symporter
VLMREAPEHFKMIMSGEPTASSSHDINKYLTFLNNVLCSWYLIINLNYWGCNHTLRKRALGADLQTARTGIYFKC